MARTRAEQLIAVATGKTTVEEVQEKQREADRSYRARKRVTALSSCDDKLQQALPPPEQDPHAALMARITVANTTTEGTEQ